MSALRILHVDDEPDIREIVELCLGLDPAFTVRSCASGRDALATAADWSPDLILCDVMMPTMDGPATLARLRECPQTADTPVVFMTARAQRHELEHFKSLGATGVIAKPFDPMTLADAVRCHLRTAGLAALRIGFIGRMRGDAERLVECRERLRHGASTSQTLEEIKSFAHALGGAAGIFAFQKVSCAASALELSAIDALAGSGTPGKVERELDALLDCIERV
jgi:two-component system OmpR family response regulator